MGSPKHLSTTPSEGFGPSRRQTTPPKPLRSSLQTTLPIKLIRKTEFPKETPDTHGSHFCTLLQKLLEGLVEGRTVTEGDG